MRRHERILFGLRTALALGLVATFTAPPPAHAGGHRLYRHRSGYLHGASRPCAHRAVRYDGYYGGGFGLGGGSRGFDQYADYEQRDFDARRDRLLSYASRIDVSYLAASTRPGPARTQPVEGGWVFLRDGEAVKALGKFTARLMVAPGDAQARVGFALAAALLDDHGAAAEAMRTAVRFDGNVLSEFRSDDALDDVIRGIAERLRAEDGKPSADARFLLASMHGLLGEHHAALALLADLGSDEVDRSTEALCAVLDEPTAALVSNTPTE